MQMKTGTLLLVGGLALAAYEYAQLNTAVGTVQFMVAGINFKSLTDYEIQLLVQNVSNANVDLNALTGIVTINGSQIGNITDFSPVNIAPRSQQIVNIDLQPNLLSIPGAVQNLINNPGSTFNIAVSGNANVNNLVIPFSANQSISV